MTQGQLDNKIRVLSSGTNMTQGQLDNKISSQLMEHKQLLDQNETEILDKDRPDSAGSAEEKANKEETEKMYMKKDTLSMQEIGSRIQCLELELERERRNEREVLLKKREKQEENTLKKSVSFRDEVKLEDLEKNCTESRRREEAFKEAEFEEFRRTRDEEMAWKREEALARRREEELAREKEFQGISVSVSFLYHTNILQIFVIHTCTRIN